ncbi:hypothetical protein CVV26_00055 [Candidatus Kuenenbacteria bacterium HGW-Kuenenbacteria-1]|uniref:PKD domain-containing protein n=1 Tax=Candidatus Kuenenbacteria bacterium HGW-Kuenenbacteria-1 TaxID=2013812 RepID=A0A2N1UP31_9BACT|nr:MAG: hypothetical protein CVV26_00055 [Candidatus Kuenenbacteria bacterium HGW-Kuenenbacteria-1]
MKKVLLLVLLVCLVCSGIISAGADEGTVAVLGPSKVVVGATTTFTIDVPKNFTDWIESVKFSFGDGVIAEGFVVTHTYLVPGVRTITVEVVGMTGIATSELQIEVEKNGFLEKFRDRFSEGAFGLGPYHIEIGCGVRGTNWRLVAVSSLSPGEWVGVGVEKEWRIGLFPEDFFSLAIGHVWAKEIRDFSLQGEYHHPFSKDLSLFFGNNLNIISLKKEGITMKGFSHEPFVGLRILLPKRNGWILDVFWNPEFASLQGGEDSEKESEVGLGAFNLTLKIPLGKGRGGKIQ